MQGAEDSGRSQKREGRWQRIEGKRQGQVAGGRG